MEGRFKEKNIEITLTKLWAMRFEKGLKNHYFPGTAPTRWLLCQYDMLGFEPLMYLGKPNLATWRRFLSYPTTSLELYEFIQNRLVGKIMKNKTDVQIRTGAVLAGHLIPVPLRRSLSVYVHTYIPAEVGWVHLNKFQKDNLDGFKI